MRPQCSHVSSVKRGKIVLDHGTPEEIEAVANGTTNVRRASIALLGRGPDPGVAP
jgi:hypothetical protein